MTFLKSGNVFKPNRRPGEGHFPAEHEDVISLLGRKQPDPGGSPWTSTNRVANQHRLPNSTQESTPDPDGKEEKLPSVYEKCDRDADSTFLKPEKRSGTSDSGRRSDAHRHTK